MTADRLRAYLLTLPHAVETMQWGDNLVFWVGDKAIGGKIFALINLDRPSPDPTHKPHGVLSYPAGPARFPQLIEIDGLVPAPYMARNHWVAAQHWDVFRDPELRSELLAAHAITLAKLPPKTRKILALPASEQRRLIAERRRMLAAKSKS